jgi:cysteine sulfinate desulfinase/cysteine desulfurase-like protein/glyoxylase-like metal-dependent hydrolase (beta-lactamase superfamily II)/rhodanese-related sulfurtransferase
MVGLRAKHLLEGARAKVAQAVGATPENIVFTSGATEAIQTAVFSVLEWAVKNGLKGCDRVLYGATEHKAVPEALHHWVKALGLPVKVVKLPVDSNGQIRQDMLREELPSALLLCTMAVNNETGVVQNLAAIEKALVESGSPARWLVDCVQALGKEKLALASSRIDYAPFSGHKLYAPKGIGFLYLAKDAPYVPLIVGGGQERGLRSGTENLPGVAALGAMVEELGRPGSAFQSVETLKRFRDRIVSTLREVFPKVQFNSPFGVSVPTTVNFSVPGMSSKELLDLFDSAGIRLSAGSACSSKSVEPSYVLDAMGVPEERSVSALRLSFGPCTTEEEIERGCKLLKQAALALQSSCLLDVAGGFDPPEQLRDGVVQLRVGATNTWIFADRDARTAVIIDPCETVADRIESYVRCQGLQVLAVLDTHSHADHQSVRPQLEQILGQNKAVDELGWPGGDIVTLADGTRAQALRLGKNAQGDRVLARVATPGHTNDSHALLVGTARQGKLAAADVDYCFCGDTVLSGGLGRTNFVVSDVEALFSSLRNLGAWIGPRTLLCPAHDYNNSFATTLEAEARSNALLRLAIDLSGPAPREVVQQFVQGKKEIDHQLEALERDFHGIVCGVTGANSAAADRECVLSSSRVREEMKAKATAYEVIDVREPHETVLEQDWSTLGLSKAPRNVPLSRFVNFMREVLSGPDTGRRYVLVCRSGNRSLQAAKSLRRSGYLEAWSLEGGIALL